MASKRLAVAAIDWAKIYERVPENQKTRFLAFRAQSDSYLRRMNANPEQPPKIEWSYYKKYVMVPGMVDDFQKKYEGLQIPYPKDSVSNLIDTQEKEMKQEVANFKTASNERIKSYKEEISRLRSLLPFDQMTMEDYAEAFPDLALDPINNPTFWPHDDDEIADYPMTKRDH